MFITWSIILVTNYIHDQLDSDTFTGGQCYISRTIHWIPVFGAIGTTIIIIYEV